MVERKVHTDVVRAGAPVTLGAVALLPIVRTVLRGELAGGRTWIAASKQVHALILRDAAGIRAVDADARPVTIDALRRQLPEIDAWLARL
jgi:hypothetical protein